MASMKASPFSALPTGSNELRNTFVHIAVLVPGMPFLVFVLVILFCLPGFTEQIPSALTQNATNDTTHNSSLPDGQAAPDESGEGAAVASTGQNGTVYQFKTVKVVADKLEAGKATVSGQELQTMPTRTGSITEALKVVPNVQFANEEASSLTAGEIRPPRVSIAGAKPYENNFLIDGLSITNTLNPNGLDADGDAPGASRLDVNGADQAMFIDTSLVDVVSVYTSNVPAKYGNFVGGVVDAKLVDPRTDRWHGVLTGMHSRNEWYDLRGVDEQSTTATNQPRFDIYDVKAKADGPLSENAALLLAVSQKWSEIPLKLEARDGSLSDEDQYRKNQNFFGKLLFTPSSVLKLTMDATYAPYTEKWWNPTWKDSDWTVENEAWRIGFSAEQDTVVGKWTGKVAYSENGYSRDSSSNFREQIQGSGIPWSEQIAEGALGDAIVKNRSLDVGLDYDVKEFNTGELIWRVSTGAQLTNVNSNLWNEAAYLENRSVPASGKWTQIYTNYPEFDQSKTLNTAGAYIQSEIEWDRLTLTPGLRVDYDDFSDNTNVAPRLKVEYDTMGDRTLRLVAGVNRYYGGQLRAYFFDRWRPSYSMIERWSGSVSYSTGTDKSYLAQGLDTPYSDELMGGALGEIAGLEYCLEVVHRDHKDQIVSKAKEKDIYELTNDGKSSYDGITLSLSRSLETEKFGNHKFSLGATQSWTKTFDGAYDSEIDVYKESNGYPFDYGTVYYNGELISRSDLPADNFASPVVVTFSWLGSFLDDRLRMNCVTRWKDSYTGLVGDDRTADETPYGTTATKVTTPSALWLDEDGYYHNALKKAIISGGFVTDFSLEADAYKDDTFTFSLLLNVYNLFASDGFSFTTSPDFARIHDYGRAYYAGVRCEF